MEKNKNPAEPIAIIGIGCRFPGECDTPSKLWDLLKDPKDLQRPIPEERFNAKAFYNENGLYHGNSNVLHAYTLSEDVKSFDAQFFGINAVEASAMDPQQRLLLETVYEAVESAGLKMSKLQGTNVGVYVGLMCNDYESMLLRDLDTMPTYHATGIGRSIMSNRISYFFDWTGPSMTIDTACSSSLIALHEAVQLLRQGRTKVAVAAGTNLILGPENFIGESKLKMLSPTGRSRMWDADADGYARGEGVAAVILKPLSAAIADGDNIECIVRETGTNQDGRSQGITHPSSTAQANLIREVYLNAGLDATDPRDRPQFFEAHGTGTPAGDPIEASAIAAAFFPKDSEDAGRPVRPLYCGSVKTVIGHTEGTAGLAAVVKAALALKHAKIPPNLLFHRLNPALQSSYRRLRVPTALTEWPITPEATPRRASVNSFGFGGANAHAILESFDGQARARDASPTAAVPCHVSPFVFSAASEESLRELFKRYSDHLQRRPETNLLDLGFTLDQRRSIHSYRKALTAPSSDVLQLKLEEMAKGPLLPPAPRKSTAPAILGVFTGQGAQWPAMGRQLLRQSPKAWLILSNLEQVLSRLPDAPAWSITDEILAEGSKSRIKDAEISQPACTAIQIILVDLVKAGGIKFKAVLGHSSGEITAAYAAGYLSAEAAIITAYYRGKHASLAAGRGGELGAMVAVSTTAEDAEELCQLPDFRGRLCIAAYNSPTSVTMSGDVQAVKHAQVVFEDEEKMAKLLFVDKAYHSHHMLQCSDAYLSSLEGTGVAFHQKLAQDCPWVSSVYNQPASQISQLLTPGYWNENMVQPVLFTQAIETAYRLAGPFDLAIEIGPHPALKRPVIETYQAVHGSQIPYSALLQRNKDDVEAFAAGLGQLWELFGDAALDLARIQNFASSKSPNQEALAGLPTYPWTHDRKYWHESRVSRGLRTRSSPTHELLGNLLPDGTEHTLRWRNYMSVREMPWLEGHKLQEQTVFPAAGYVSMALEATKSLFPERSRKLLEVRDLTIQQAMAFQDDDSAVETLFTLFEIAHTGHDVITASFTIESTVGKDANRLTPTASGSVFIELGEPADDLLPLRGDAVPNLIPVPADRFYNSLVDIGYHYTGPFKGLSELSRNNGHAQGLISNHPSSGEPENPLFIHPATLDLAIQAIILAHSYPYDGQLFAIHVPVQISCVRLNVGLCKSALPRKGELPFVASTYRRNNSINGDVDMYTMDAGLNAMLQVEGIKCVLFSEATEKDDAQMFSTTEWAPQTPNGAAVCFDGRASEYEYTLAHDLERACFFYLEQWAKLVPEDNHSWHTVYQGMFRFMCHIRSKVQQGQHAYAHAEWSKDTEETMSQLRQKHPDSLDFRIIDVVGTMLPAVLRNETTILEHLMQDNLLNDYYANALGFPSYTRYLARMVAQLVHRYPHMHILEIGAGTGGATKGIFKEIGSNFTEYTFTDISSGFFDTAQQVFHSQAHKMKFRALNIEDDPSQQGFEKNSYDLVVASFVLHATKTLRQTLQNARSLLKPGGFLLMLEMTDNEPMRTGFIFGALPQWWSGAGDGRVLSPCVEPLEWHRLLCETGFSGIDSITADRDRLPHPASVILSQAVDTTITALREPMITLDEKTFHAVKSLDLIILGGATLHTCIMTDHIAKLLSSKFATVTSVPALKSLDSSVINKTTVILSLIDLDRPVFMDIGPEQFEALKSAFETSYCVSWYTRGCRADDPHANMIRGFARSLLWELPELRLQLLDFEMNPEPNAIAHTVLQFCLATSMQAIGTLNSSLWSIEPELVLQHDKTLVPRIKPNKAQNARFNSTRRQIIVDADPREHCLELRQSTSGFHLEQNHTVKKPGDSALVDVAYSSASALRLDTGLSAFLVFGKLGSGGGHILGLSQTNASKIFLSSDCIIPVDSTAITRTFFSNLVTSIVLRRILSTTITGTTLMVHGADNTLALVLEKACLAKEVKCLFTTTDVSKTASKSWRVLHPWSRTELFRQTVAHDTSVFVDLSTDQSDKRVAAGLTGFLPRGCQSYDSDLIFSPTSSNLGHAGDGHFATQLLDEALDNAKDMCLSDSLDPGSPCIRITELSKMPTDTCSRTTISWQIATGQSCAALLRPFDSETLFHSDKTYWLVGLTGDLGLSLCEYMHQKGAAQIVLSSRNPKIDARWLAELRKRGAMVEVLACDVTKFDSISEAHDHIRNTLPPIAGVVQGAMVLHDTPVRDMTYELLQKVLRPKVQGSINLNRIFNMPDLDFFIYFSSMTGVVGNIGQANYTAANAFMMSQAAQRRERGLSGSVINIGAIIGVGYVTRELSQANQDNLFKGGYLFMSEQAFHQAFSEAVVAGRPGSPSDPEISTGLRMVNRADQNLPIWVDNPRFSHHVIPHDNGDSDQAVAGNTQSISSRLQLCATPADLHAMIFESFTAKLCSLLRMEMDISADRANILAKRTDDFGIDSLVAVEIRTWFLKTLGVNVPVLKILGGAAIEEIVEYAAERMSPSMIPNMGKEGKLAKPTPPPRTEPRPSTSKLAVSNDSKPSPSQESGASGNIVPSALNSSISFVAAENSTPAHNYGTTPAGSHTGTSSPSANFSSSEDRDINTPSVASSYSASLDAPSDMVALVKKTPAVTRPSPQVREVRRGPLSYIQEMFFFVHHFTTDRTTLNHTGSFRVVGSIDVDKLKYAVKAIGARHESLRTKYVYSAAHEPVQVVLEHSALDLEVVDVADDTEVDTRFAELCNYDYDIEYGQTNRAMLLRVPGGSSYLLLGCHHINTDGVTFKVLLADLERAYKQQLYPSPPTQYLDYAILQKREYDRGLMKADLDYWKSEFRTVPQPLPILSLPDAQQRSGLINYDFSRAKIHLDTNIVSSIKAVCKPLGATPFHFHLSVFRVLLARFMDTEEICIGLCDANRTSEDLMTAVGAYINLLPLCLPVDRKAPFADVIINSKKKVFEVLSHAQVPFGLLLNELNVPRSDASSPLFQAFIDYRLGHKQRERFADCQLELLEFEQGRTAYDVNLDILETETGCTIDLMLQKSLYSEGDAKILSDAYVSLVKAFMINTQQTMDEPPVHAHSKISQAIDLGKGPLMRSEWPNSIVRRVQDMCSRFPYNVAITDGSNASLTYNQMSTRTNSIAHTLLSSGVGAGSRVGVFQHPTADWICCLLAIWSLGAIYIPLDLSTPLSRLARMVQDSQPSVVLTSEDTLEAVDEVVGDWILTINVDNISTSWNRPIDIHPSLNEPCAILYTSGSTGTPKGISLSAENIRDEVEFSAKSYGIGREKVLQQSSLGFDMAFTQIFGALAFGGSMHMVSLDARGDPRAIVRIINKEQITMTAGTPSEYQTWIQFSKLDATKSLSSWRLAISGGEQVGRPLLASFRSLETHTLRLYNAYGPTEVTCSSHRMALDFLNPSSYSSGRIPAGRAAPNVAAYLLDRQGCPLPVGISGEIAIAGAGVARGYTNHDGLTQERFVDNRYLPPFFKEKGWTTMHKTGDRGRLLSDGNLVVEGRIEGDTQVKLSGGLRVDLLEIENTILQQSHGQIHEAVVCLHRATDEPDVLALYAVCSPVVPESVCLGFVQKLVATLPLPQYMRPTAVEVVEHIPKTSSGKVDRKAVSNLSWSPVTAGTTTRETLSNEQSELLRIWTSVLPRRAIANRNIDHVTDFFHVGGTSMLLITLRHRIQESFGVELALVDMFKASTLGEMALLIENHSRQTSQTTIDWKAEIALPDLGSSSWLPISAPSRPRSVVLTGSTGFLGRKLLEVLLADDRIHTIHCVAVRHPNLLGDLATNPHVKVYKGDLTLLNLGLSSQDSTHIFSTADAIIHNGADVSHLKVYSTLKQANTTSTLQLIQLCFANKRKIPIHFISTAGVALWSGLDVFGERSAAEWKPPTNGFDGYTASKWASERLLEQACALHGLPVTIHRPSNISREGQAPDMDLFQNLLRYCRDLNAVPRSSNLTGTLNLVSVDECAGMVVDALFDEVVKGVPQYVNEIGPVNLDLEDLGTYVRSAGDAGMRVKSIELGTWVDLAEHAGLNPAVAAFFRRVERDTAGGVRYPRLIKGRL